MQVAKIKGDEREDLKVLATGVAAAFATRKVNFPVDCHVCFLCNNPPSGSVCVVKSQLFLNFVTRLF